MLVNVNKEFDRTLVNKKNKIRRKRERIDSVGYTQVSLTKGLTMKLLTWR